MRPPSSSASKSPVRASARWISKPPSPSSSSTVPRSNARASSRLPTFCRMYPSTGSPAISRARTADCRRVAGRFVHQTCATSVRQRTLVLVNGKRLGINTNGLQDVTTIPTAIIQSVEILKDGASSVYGSDAIGGVINFITRRNFEGMEANAYWGQYSEGDGDIQRWDATLGYKGDKGSLVVVAEYSDEKLVNSARTASSRQYPRGQFHPIPRLDHGEPVGRVGSQRRRNGGNLHPRPWRQPVRHHELSPDQRQPRRTVTSATPTSQTDLRTPIYDQEPVRRAATYQICRLAALPWRRDVQRPRRHRVRSPAIRSRAPRSPARRCRATATTTRSAVSTIPRPANATCGELPAPHLGDSARLGAAACRRSAPRWASRARSKWPTARSTGM